MIFEMNKMLIKGAWLMALECSQEFWASYVNLKSLLTGWASSLPSHCQPELGPTSGAYGAQGPCLDSCPLVAFMWVGVKAKLLWFLQNLQKLSGLSCIPRAQIVLLRQGILCALSWGSPSSLQQIGWWGCEWWSTVPTDAWSQFRASVSTRGLQQDH